MTRYLDALLVLLASVVVHAIPYDGPVATPVLQRFADNGWTPKPTTAPRPLLELFKRQEDPGFCGYLEGDGDSPVSCRRGSSCMYDEVYSWFGCCTGTDITDCNVATACVPSKSMDECLEDESCYGDPLALACTSRAAPFCLQLYTVITSQTYGHFECASTSTILEVLATVTDSTSLSPFFSIFPSSSFFSALDPSEVISDHTKSSTDDNLSRTRTRRTSLSDDVTESEIVGTITTSEFQFSFSVNTPTSTGTPSTVVTGTQAPAPAASTGVAQRNVVAVGLGVVGSIASFFGLLV